ncbi:putative reverse transcriptase domain-containing protein [Tanacetum coccineum]
MMTARKRVGPLPTHRLAVRHSVDYSSLDIFTSDDSSETSSDHPSLALPSGTRSSHQLCLSVLSIPHSPDAITERPSHFSFASPSRKRSRSPTTSVPISSPIPGALFSARADFLPPPKRIRSFDFATDLKDCSDESSESSRETSLGDDVVVRGSDEPYSKPDIDPEIHAKIDECIEYADALRAEGIDTRVVVDTVDREEVKTRARGPVKVRFERVTHPAVPDDIPEPTQEEGAIEGTYETLGDLVQRFHDHTVEIPVHRVQRGSVSWSRIIRDLEVRWVLRVRETMPNTRSGATMTREVVNKPIARRVAKALEARDATRNLEPLVEGGGDKKTKMGMEMEEMEMEEKTAMEMVMGTEEEMAITSEVSCLLLEIKYATCTLMNSALTWWNSHKRAIGIETAYAMTWTKLMKLMTEVYCPRNEIQKIETEMVPDEEDKVERFIGGLPDNIQGNGYARNAENKRRFDNNPKDNRGQQPAFKRQNVGGQNVARAYTARSNKRKGYVGSLPYCNKCRLHHEGPCTVRCGNCKRVGHMTKDCTDAVALNTQRALVGNQPGVVCYEYGRPGHYRKDCPKLRNHNRADRSFVSSNFSALLDVAPSTLDTSYAVELADGRLSETIVILRGLPRGDPLLDEKDRRILTETGVDHRLEAEDKSEE